jgi:aminopeptidase N
MKKIYYYLLVFSSFIGFAQDDTHDFHGIVESEMKSASKNMNLRINPNTSNYDITKAQLEFTIDPAVYAISGKVTTTFKALSTMNTVTFDLYKKSPAPFTISSVKINNVSTTYTYSSTHELIINLPTSLTTGNTAVAEVVYNGAPSTAEQAFTRSTHGTPSKPVIYTLSEPYGARDWWPCKQDLTDKIDEIDIYITSPSEYLSASNGKEISRTDNGTTATTHFQHKYPIPAYLVAVAVTNYTKKNTGTAGTTTTFPIIDYIYPESDNSTTATNLARTIPIMNFFESKVGPYPFNLEKYGHTQWNWGGGMEHSTNSFMVNFNRGLLAHELAHQWFGDKITCGSWKDIWLNEGITEYMAGLVVEEFDNPNNPAAFTNWKSSKISSILSYSGLDTNLYLDDSQLSNVGRIFSSQITYNKGTMVTHMLRKIMGDTNFFQALRNYLNDPLLAYKYAVTPQFQAHLEAVHGSSLQEFFNDWVYGKGYPSYTITGTNSTTFRAATRKVTIQVNQTQSDPSVSFFEMPIPIKISLSDGSFQYETLNHTFSGQTFDIVVPVPATSVTFNEDKDIISSNLSEVTLSNVDFDLSTKISLYPNPSADKMTIQLPSSVTLTNVVLYNTIGQKVLENIEETIDVSQLSSGIYQVVIDTNEGSAHKKFIKK